MLKRFFVLFIVITTLFLTVSSVSAATLTVNAVSPYAAADGLCSLVEAIDNANDDAATHADCPAGAGADIIELTTAVVLNGTTVFPPSNAVFFDSGNSGLPEIASDITITGGALTRVGATDFRFFVVQPGASLTLDNTALVNGRVSGSCPGAGVDATGCGGAIVSRGDLTINRVSFRNNQAVESIAADFPGGGAIQQLGGTTTITESSFTGNSSEYGGAINGRFTGDISISDTVFSNNVATASGGAIYNGTTNNLTIFSSTFTNNRVTLAPFNFNGGGAIDNAGSNSQLIVSGSTFTGNSARSGGAINNFNASDAFISNSTFTGNTAVEAGGAILNRGSGATLNLVSSTVSNNVVTQAFGNGGGISNGGTSDTGITNIANSIISNNQAGDGGGISTQGTLSIETSTITGNSATVGEGGGIFVGSLAGQSVTIDASTISNNTANREGGGIFYTENPSGMVANLLTINDSTIDNNRSTEGGGVYAARTNVGIARTTISNNQASNIGLGGGGGLYLNSVSIGTLSNSTISGNSATQDGGGIYVNNGSTLGITSSTIANNTNNSASGADGIHSLVAVAGVTVQDTIVANNGNRNCLGAPFGVTDNGNNISSDTTCGFVGAGIGDGVNPLLGALADNGGYARTHALLAGSPAIDAGSAACPATDERLAARALPCDIGAYEAIIAPPAVVTISVDETTLYEDGTVTVATITVTVDNTAPGAQIANLIIPLRVTGTATGISVDYTLSNQDGLAAAFPGFVQALNFTVPAGNTASQTVTVTVVDDPVVEANELVTVIAEVIGNASISGTDTLNVTIISDDVLPVQPPVVAPTVESDGSIGVFDPAISKIGFLTPGDTGVVGETLEWVVTVTNTGASPGNNVTITDTLISALRVDSVNAPGANASINGQTVTVTYPTLAVGQSVQFSIFTTVLDGTFITNTACVNADNQAETECFTGSIVSQLPQTGEASPWRNPLLVIIVLMGIAGFSTLVRSRKRKHS